jgi:transmembrane sensor
MIETQKDLSRAQREAADWFSRLMDTRIENEELEAFAAWRRDPDNLAAYNRIDDISRLARSLKNDPEMRAVAQAAHARGKKRFRLADLWRRPNLTWPAALAMASLLLVAAVGWKMTSPTYSTPVGRQLEARLADGSRVQLNTDTAIKVRFAKGVRSVELLRGQAFFDVAHDPSHPFVVTAGDTEVRAIGTRFDVRRETGRVQVMLAEGKVAVQERGQTPVAWTLSPGQALTTGRQQRAIAPAAADVSAATAWTSGKVTFRDTPLSEAVREINRYSRDKIILGPDAPADGRINGIFSIGKPDEFVTAVSALYDLRSDRRLNGDTELRGPAPPKG